MSRPERLARKLVHGEHHKPSITDRRAMAQALALARRGMGCVYPNPPVGAVVVSGGRVVGRGWHRAFGGDHAEAEALRQAGHQARGADLLVTLEPCAHQGKTPPCTQAILDAGIRRVVMARQDPNPNSGSGADELRQHGVQVEAGTPAEAITAAHLLAGFESLLARKRPRIALKLAASLDGKLASTSGDSRWISSPQSRAWVHRRRAESDAVLIGRGTALKDNPQLTVRLVDGESPDRVVVDSLLKIPPTHRIWNEDGCRRLLFTTDLSAPEARGAISDLGVDVHVVGSDENGAVSLPRVAAKLGELGYTNVLCEGGGKLAGSLLREKLVDVIWLMMARNLILGGSAGWTQGLESARVTRGLKVSRSAITALGPDWLVTAVPEYAQWSDPATASPPEFADKSEPQPGVKV